MRTGDTNDGFLARQISHMDKSIVEGGEDVSNAKDEFTLCDLRTERNSSFFSCDFLFGRL